MFKLCLNYELDTTFPITTTIIDIQSTIINYSSTTLSTNINYDDNTNIFNHFIHSTIINYSYLSTISTNIKNSIIESQT